MPRPQVDPHAGLRSAAFSELARLVEVHGRVLGWEHLKAGFSHDGSKHHFASQALGIFNPKAMRIGALSIKSTVPRPGRIAAYDDFARGDDSFTYKLQGKDPDNHANRSLHETFELQAPLIYFFGVMETQYEAIFPVQITRFDRAGMECVVAPMPAYGIERIPLSQVADAPIEKRYMVGPVKRRLHQDAFRVRVLDAYRHRCAVCGLPSDELLQAVHIRPDADVLGEPTVNNGLG